MSQVMLTCWKNTTWSGCSPKCARSAKNSRVAASVAALVMMYHLSGRLQQSIIQRGACCAMYKKASLWPRLHALVYESGLVECLVWIASTAPKTIHDSIASNMHHGVLSHLIYFEYV